MKTGEDLFSALIPQDTVNTRGRVRVPLPVGITYHAINTSVTFGNARALEGILLVEDETGCFRRVTGEELSEFYHAYPDFVKNWSLDIE